MTDAQSWKDTFAREVFTYERLMARSVQTNSMQWQAPSLALAAQAFLLTIALRPGVSALSATIVCFVGLVTTVMALQLMARHRFYFHLDQRDMQDLEKALGILGISDRKCQEERHPSRRPAWLGGQQSFRVWQVGLLLIVLVDISIALDAWFPAEWVAVGMGAALLTAEGFLLLAWPWHVLFGEDSR